MAKYPVMVKLPHKLLKNLPLDIALKQRRKIEDYLNERAKDSPATVFYYGAIASDTGIDKEIVMDFLYPLSGSNVGIAIIKPQLERGTGNR
jgi:hypothetical protein